MWLLRKRLSDLVLECIIKQKYLLGYLFVFLRPLCWFFKGSEFYFFHILILHCTVAWLSCTVIYTNVLTTTSLFIYWKVNHTLITSSSKDYKVRDGMLLNDPSLSNTKRKLLKLEIFNVSMQDLGCYYSCGVKFNKDVLVEATKICLLRLPREEASGILGK